MKRRGFTLIELLAVIVLLAFIAVIAVPVILRIVESSKKGSAIDSAYGVKKAAQYYYANTYEVDISEESGNFTCDFSNSSCDGLKLSGTKPTSGTLHIDSNGDLHFNDLVINGYNVIYIEDEEKFIISDSIEKKYVVTFNTNGGSNVDYMLVKENDELTSISTPTREQYVFLGWYLDEKFTTEVSMPLVIDSNKTLYARWLKDEFPVVFSLEGPCTFNGQTGNITGSKCSKYSNTKYIDTNVKLYDKENYKKDYEIYFEIDSYDPNLQDAGIAQQTFMNEKLEISSIGYPGIVFRRSGNNLEITQTIERVKVQYTRPYKQITKVRIVRKDGIIYYSFNNDELKDLQDMNNFKQYFDTTVWFGASADGNNKPFRYLRGTLSNMHIKVGKYKE